MNLLATLTLPDEAATLRFANWLAPRLRDGDIVSLEGELGVGKTALARAIIRCLCGAELDVPSPTFTLVQNYQAAQCEIIHADFYRLKKPQEVDELGLFEDCTQQIMLLEWADRLGDKKLADCLCLHIAEDEAGDKAESTMRYLTVSGTADFASRLKSIAAYASRDKALMAFIAAHDWQTAKYTPIIGDASSRRYARLARNTTDYSVKGEGGATPAAVDVASGGLTPHTAIVMDWPPRSLSHKPLDKALDKAQGKTKARQTYAAETHLAQNPAAFVAVANFLTSCGLSAPQIYGADFVAGFLLLEDFGTQTLTDFIDRRDPHLPIFYHEAMATLAHLHSRPAPAELTLPNGDVYQLHHFDIDILMSELAVFLDSYLAWRGISVTKSAREEWQTIWRTLLPKAANLPPVLVLRDYHSPNLHWLESRQTIARIGLIDIQDALIGSCAYDVVSLLQDARRDVDNDLAAHLLAFYFEERQFNGADETAFKTAYAILGAQRNFRIAGVFTRLAHDNYKPSYLIHLPRVTAYIEQNLQHPVLADVKNWLRKYMPEGF